MLQTVCRFMPTHSLLRSCAVSAVSMGPAVTESSTRSPQHLKSVAVLERSPPRENGHGKPSVSLVDKAALLEAMGVCWANVEDEFIFIRN